jgi:hypothetical protein
VPPPFGPGSKSQPVPESITPSMKNLATPPRQRAPRRPLCSSSASTSSSVTSGSISSGTTERSVRSPRASSSSTSSSSHGQPSIAWPPVSPSAFSARSVAA